MSTMNISPDTRLLVEKYTALAETRERHGSMTKMDWEDARSYAVEALNGLLRDNPEKFDFTARMEAVRRRSRINQEVKP